MYCHWAARQLADRLADPSLVVGVGEVGAQGAAAVVGPVGVDARAALTEDAGPAGGQPGEVTAEDLVRVGRIGELRERRGKSDRHFRHSRIARSTLSVWQTNADGKLIKVPPAKVGLSTSSVYPETTSSAFELARRLGYDGVELMVGIDPVAADIDAVEKLRDYHSVPVLSVHAPCLLITQRVWGTDPWAKLRALGRGRPPARGRRGGGASAVPLAARVRPRVRRRGAPAGRGDRDHLRGGEHVPVADPGGELKAYMPGWDPTELDYDDLTLDFSHASTANQQSLDLARAWGDRLRHVHLTDGTGSVKDEHLVPGRGDQQPARCWSTWPSSDFAGHVVLEVNTRRPTTRAQREADLAESLAFARLHLATPVRRRTRWTAGGSRQRACGPGLAVPNACSPE